MELKCAEKELANEKLCSSCTEEKLNVDIKTLKDELKTKGQTLCDLEASYKELSQKLHDSECKCLTLTTKLKKLQNDHEKYSCELKNQISELKEENQVMLNDLYCLRRQLKDLLIEKDHIAMQINKENFKLGVFERGLEQVQLIQEQCDQFDKKLNAKIVKECY